MIKKVNCCVMYSYSVSYPYWYCKWISLPLFQTGEEKHVDIWYVMSIPQILKRNGVKMFQTYFIGTQKKIEVHI